MITTDHLFYIAFQSKHFFMKLFYFLYLFIYYLCQYFLISIHLLPPAVATISRKDEFGFLNNFISKYLLCYLQVVTVGMRRRRRLYTAD